MWETLDFRDRALVRFQVRELRREAAMRRLARAAGGPRRSVLSAIAHRLSPRRAEAA
jgi:hypothetical protein